MTREQANNKNANPNYGKGLEYSLNCQSCVIAFEARLRGYNVCAKPNYKLPNSTAVNLARNQSLAWKHNVTGFRPSFKISIEQGASLYNWLQKEVKKGQRFTFGYRYLGKNGNQLGHIVCIDRTVKNQLRMYDPQVGKTYISGDIRRFIQSRGIIKSKLLRIDNCTFNIDLVEDVVEKLK